MKTFFEETVAEEISYSLKEVGIYSYPKTVILSNLKQNKFLQELGATKGIRKGISREVFC